MTLYLGRRVVAGVVDETSSVYLGRCDVPDCRYLADHADALIVEDALDGHRHRAHATTIPERSEDDTRTGWIPAFTYGPAEPLLAERSTAAPAWTPANDPHMPPTPYPREES